MEIRGSDGDSRLVLVAVELSDRQLPSVRVRAELRIGGFSAAADSVWFETSAIDSFVAQIRTLEAKRQGAALLSAMSPGGCELRLETCDRAGHLRLHVQLSKTRYVCDESHPTTLAGSFEMDAELLLGMSDQVEGLRRVEPE